MSTTADQILIQELSQRYADGVMTRNVDVWSSTWAEDGVWYLGTPEPITGREAIKQVWLGAMGGYPVVLHLVQPGIIEVDGDTAKARWYIQESIITSDDERIWNFGVYNDTLKKEGGEWKFASRKFDCMYRGPVDLSGSLDGFKEFTANGSV